MADALARATEAQIVLDPDPDGVRSPWRTYRAALESTPHFATHRLILQDDVTLCRDFLEVATRAITAQPERLISFFVGGLPREHARMVLRGCERDLSWAELDCKRWTPALALAWPVEMIRPFLDFVDRKEWPEAALRADDEIIGKFMRHENLLPLATVPSLVEHEDVVPSLIGRRHRAGRDSSRVAACFIHPDCDPLSIDWTLGPT